MDYSAYLVPLLLAFTALFGLWKRVNVYDALSLGAKEGLDTPVVLSLIHISEPTRPISISYAVFCLKKKKITKSQYI